MWLLTVDGMYSVVDKDGGPVVRSRVKGDLERLVERHLPAGVGPIVATPNNDYPYRLHVTREQLGSMLLSLGEGVTYPNFKDEVTRRQGKKRHDIYSRIWGVLCDLETYRWGRRPGQQPLRGSSYLPLIFTESAPEPLEDRCPHGVDLSATDCDDCDWEDVMASVGA